MARYLITVVAVLLCGAAVCAVLVQRQKLAVLRKERAELGPTAKHAEAETEPAGAADGPGPASTQPFVSPELLRLRSEVTRLTARQTELAGVQAEGERLRAQLSGTASNASAGYQLPVGYIRKSQARAVGYATPEDTIQSFLWALHNHDFTNLLQALTSTAAERLQAQIQQAGGSPEDYFKETDVLPGLALQNAQTEADGTIRVVVQVAPALGTNASSAGGTGIDNLRFRCVNGEWKLDLPF